MRRRGRSEDSVDDLEFEEVLEETSQNHNFESTTRKKSRSKSYFCAIESKKIETVLNPVSQSLYLRDRLRRARDYASSCDEVLMEACIQEAKAVAIDLQVDDESFNQEIEEITSIITPDLRRTKIKVQIEKAKRYAIQGNQSLMKYFVSEARRLAVENGITEEDISQQIEEIQASLTPEAKRRHLEVLFQKAMDHAQKCDQILLECTLQDCESVARELDCIDESYRGRVTAIRNIVSLDLKRVSLKKQFQDAEKFAKEGNRHLMEFCLSCARKLAEELDCSESDIEDTIHQIEAALKGITVDDA